MADPLPGVALSDEQSPAAHSREVKIRKMLVNFEFFVSVFRRFSPTLSDPHSCFYKIRNQWKQRSYPVVESFKNTLNHGQE